MNPSGPLKRISKNGQISVGKDLAERVVQVERGQDGVFLRFVDVVVPEAKPSRPLDYNEFVFELCATGRGAEIIGIHGIMQDVARRKHEAYLRSFDDQQR